MDFQLIQQVLASLVVKGMGLNFNALPTTRGMQHTKTWCLKLITAHHPSLFTPCGKDDIVYSLLSLLTALIISGFAIPSFIMGADDDSIESLDIVRLSFALLALLLITMELAYKAWKVVSKTRFKEENYDVSMSPTTNSNGDGRSVNKVAEWWKNTSLYLLMKPYFKDIVRLQAAEFILYVTVTCNIIKHAGGHFNLPYTFVSLQLVELIGLIVSLILYILHVFVAQFYVIVKGIRSLEGLRRLKFGKSAQTDNNSQSKCCYCIKKHFNMFDDQKWNSKDLAIQGVLLEIYYTFHVICQMVIQICIFVNLGFKIQCENDSDLSSGSGYVSLFTWAMFVIGFLIPNRVFGSVIFYMSTYVWIKRFPVVLVLNILDLFSNSEQCNEFGNDTKEKASMMLQSIGSQVQECKRNTCKELTFPIFSPLLSILSCFHFLLLLSFPILSMFGSIDPHFSDCSDYLGCSYIIPCNVNLAWFVYTCIAGAIAWISNYGVVTAAVWWMIIVPSMIVIILVVILGALYILLAGTILWFFFYYCCFYMRR